MAGELPLLTVAPQLDLAASQIEPVRLTLDLVLPDQVVIAKGQQGVAEPSPLELAPQLEVELPGHPGFAGVDPRQHGTDVQLAGTQVELALELVEAHLGGIHVDDEIQGALAHPVEQVGLAHPLMALAAILPT